MGLITRIRTRKQNKGGHVYVRWKKVSFQFEGT